MKKVVLYIAMSIDGYIADRNGRVNWLEGDGSEPNSSGSYIDFIETIDTIILGYNTYHQITKELSPNSWPYQGKRTYVLTHRHSVDVPSADIILTSKPFDRLISDLKEEGKDIWICGGASIINQALKYNLIDVFHFTIAPVIIGEGISLFSRHKTINELKLISDKSYNGFVDLIYEKR